MAVSGDLRDMALTTLISVNCTEHNRGQLRLQRGEQEAFIYFDAGQIVHVTLGNQEGEGVIYELLTWEDGFFELEMDVPPPAHTVSTPWSNLVLEGMRRIDEDTLELEADVAEELWTMERIEQKEVPEMATRKKRSDILAEHLETLLADSADIKAAAVVGRDGLVLASNIPMGGHDATRVGAEGTAVIGLSTRMLNTLDCGDPQAIVLEGTEGRIIATAAGPRAVVMGLTEADSNLGMALLEMRDIAVDIAEVLG